jgi:hypothetical protein
MNSAIPLAIWRELDWRMLLPDATLGRVLYVGQPSPLLIEALQELTAETRVVAPEAFARGEIADHDADTVVLSRTAGQDAAIERAFAMLRPAGWLVLSQRRARWKTPLACERRMRRCGFAGISTYWHAPSFDRCSYLVSTSDRSAVRAVLARYQGVRFGREKALAVRALLAAGAIGIVARDTTSVAQRPA